MITAKELIKEHTNINKKSLILNGLILLVALIFLFQAYTNIQIIPLELSVAFIGVGLTREVFFKALGLNLYYLIAIIGILIVGFVIYQIIKFLSKKSLDNFFNKNPLGIFITSQTSSFIFRLFLVLLTMYVGGVTFLNTKPENVLFNQFLNYYIFCFLIMLLVINLLFKTKKEFLQGVSSQKKYQNLQAKFFGVVFILMIFFSMVSSTITPIIDPSIIIKEKVYGPPQLSQEESENTWKVAQPIGIIQVGIYGADYSFLLKNNSDQNLILYKLVINNVESDGQVQKLLIKSPTKATIELIQQIESGEFPGSQTSCKNILQPGNLGIKTLKLDPCTLVDSRVEFKKENVIIYYYDENLVLKEQLAPIDIVTNCEYNYIICD